MTTTTPLRMHLTGSDPDTTMLVAAILAAYQRGERRDDPNNTRPAPVIASDTFDHIADLVAILSTTDAATTTDRPENLPTTIEAPDLDVYDLTATIPANVTAYAVRNDYLSLHRAQRHHATADLLIVLTDPEASLSAKDARHVLGHQQSPYYSITYDARTRRSIDAGVLCSRLTSETATGAARTLDAARGIATLNMLATVQ